ncbi:MAG TPA: phage portal protein [Terriglobales bacterium]|nr:phage portal protein [Terriglobales bacterium]
MNIRATLRGALRRLVGTGAPEKRRTLALPSILQTYGPRADVLPKPTPYNLRRFAETPVARKAINTVKDRVAGMRWRVQPKNGRSLAEIPDASERIRILTDNLDAPNSDDSFRSLAEQVLEDVIVGGFGAIEAQLSGDASRPLNLWPVDGASIRMRTDWDGRPDSPRYVQVAGAFSPNTQIVLNDDELIYIRLNPRTHTPFGLGRLEVAFESINAFLGAHRYAARLASNSVVQYALWLQDLGPSQHERLIRWWQDEIEGTGRVPILSVENRPEVLRFGGGTDQDLRLGWQEFLLRVIADAFDLPPFLLGLEHDVNRSTAGQLADQAFRQAIVPTARLIAEHLTRDAIGKKLGWNDLEFVFTDVDAANEMEEAQIQEILLRNGVLTVNEVRQMRGLPAIQKP